MTDDVEAEESTEAVAVTEESTTTSVATGAPDEIDAVRSLAPPDKIHHKSHTIEQHSYDIGYSDSSLQPTERLQATI